METTVLKNKASKDSKNNKWKKVMIAGVPAIALGGAIGVFAAKETDGEELVEDITENIITPTNNEPSVEPIGDIDVASTVNDDMTFAEAFAAARNEVGAGGVFEWNGGLYGTYYETEWDTLSKQEQDQFSSEAIGIPYEPAEQVESVAVAELTTEVASEPQHNEIAEVEQEPIVTPEVALEPEVVTEGQNIEEIAELEPAIEVNAEPTGNNSETVSVEPQMTVVNQERWEENGNSYTLSEVRIDEDQYILVDENGGLVEVMAFDADGNGEISNNEIIEITELEIQQSELDQLYAQNSQDNNPDIIEDNNSTDYLAENTDFPDAGF